MGDSVTATQPQAQLEQSDDGTPLVRFTGSWTMQNEIPHPDSLLEEFGSQAQAKRVGFDTQGVTQWDSALLIYLIKLGTHWEKEQVEVDRTGLPTGVQGLLKLAFAVPERKGARRVAEQVPFLVRVGMAGINAWRSTVEIATFIGEATQAFGNLLRGRARFRRSDLMLTIQEVGAQALPIVSLISLLVGMILAFVGAIQLMKFGATIYTANLVGLGMARQMGAMMTAIIMAGRTGAAFAAQLGTMQVNQEIDAFKTMGISPMEFLVLPRMLALMLMMPLLTLYSDFVGILGGFIVAITVLDLSAVVYYQQTIAAVTLTDFAVGLFMGTVFGVLVAIAGCLRGMQAGGSAASVGVATTSAVVTSIVFIVVANAIFTVILNVLGI